MGGCLKWPTERKGPDDASRQQGLWKENRPPDKEFSAKPSRQRIRKRFREDSSPDNSSIFSQGQSQGDGDDVLNLLQQIFEEFHEIRARLDKRGKNDERRQRAVSRSPPPNSNIQWEAMDPSLPFS